MRKSDGFVCGFRKDVGVWFVGLKAVVVGFKGAIEVGFAVLPA